MKKINAIELEPDEVEIENVLANIEENLPITKKLKAEVMIAKKAASNYLRKVKKIKYTTKRI